LRGLRGLRLGGGQRQRGGGHGGKRQGGAHGASQVSDAVRGLRGSGAACAAGGKISHGRPFDPTGIGIRLPIQTMTRGILKSDSLRAGIL